MVNTNPTGTTGVSVNAFDVAAQVLIMARVNDGDKFITLDYLKKTLGASDENSQTSVRLGVSAAKKSGLISKTNTKGVYSVR